MGGPSGNGSVSYRTVPLSTPGVGSEEQFTLQVQEEGVVERKGESCKSRTDAGEGKTRSIPPAVCRKSLHFFVDPCVGPVLQTVFVQSLGVHLKHVYT